MACRSISRIEDILKLSISTIHERNKLGQTPLHLASGWPAGIARLLEAGAEVTVVDERGCLPICYACLDRSIQSVKLLVAMDSPFTAPDHSCLIYAAMSDDPQMFDLVAGLIARRRKELQTFAETNVSPDELRKFEFREDTVLDSRLADVIHLLHEKHLALPSILATEINSVVVSRGTVYHHLTQHNCLKAENAQKLFERGFLNVDSINFFGYSPSSFIVSPWVDLYEDQCPNRWIELLELVCWYQGKGANLHRQDGDSGQRISHRIAESFRIAVEIRKVQEYMVSPLHKGIFSPRKTLMALFLSQDNDSCLCRCSSAGCKPITHFFKRGQPPFSPPSATSALVQCYSAVFVASSPRAFAMDHIIESEMDTMFAEVIRVLAFDKLQITHVCCEGRRCDMEGLASTWRVREKDEIYEILDEEKMLLDRLEDLVEEFVEKQRKLRLPLAEFIESHWTPRMGEVEKELKLTEEELSRIQALGVELKID